MSKYQLIVVLINILFLTGVAHAAKPDWSKAEESHAKVREIDVYYSKTCGCCKKWMSHLRQHDFKVNAKPVAYMRELKDKLGVPQEYASCHTGIIGGYLVEGHVPADDIKRILKDKPDIKGLSVPAMPVGTPGMEQSNRKDPFYVITLPKKGEAEVYKAYEEY